MNKKLSQLPVELKKKIIQLYKDGLSIGKIKKEVGLTEYMTTQVLHEANIKTKWEPYCPTQEEIKLKCLEIQNTWSEETRLERQTNFYDHSEEDY
jgi:hypothetical protein